MNKFKGKSSVWGPKGDESSADATKSIIAHNTENANQGRSGANVIVEDPKQSPKGMITATETHQQQQASYDSLREFAGSLSSLPSSDALNENPGAASPTSAPLLQTVDENGSLPDNYDAMVQSLEPASSPEAGSQDDWSDVKE